MQNFSSILLLLLNAELLITFLSILLLYDGGTDKWIDLDLFLLCEFWNLVAVAGFLCWQ